MSFVLIVTIAMASAGMTFKMTLPFETMAQCEVARGNSNEAALEAGRESLRKQGLDPADITVTSECGRAAE